jgi:hypothetical protein
MTTIQVRRPTQRRVATELDLRSPAGRVFPFL